MQNAASERYAAVLMQAREKDFTDTTLAASRSRNASAHPFVWLLTLIFMETTQQVRKQLL